MLYPENFPVKDEKKLLKLLLDLQNSKKLPQTKQQFLSAVKKLLKNTRSLKTFPALWLFRFVLERHDKQFTKNFVAALKKILVKNQVRSWSGVVPLSIFTKGVGCPFNCYYCANEPEMPKSYFSDEPAVRRAIRFHFDPYKQVFGRLQMFYLSGHPIDKIELIIQGGTFSFYDQKYREWFLKRAYDAANTSVETFIKSGVLEQKPSKSLAQAQRFNEKSKQRIIGVTVETRPDYITPKEIKFLRRLGVTRVEIGVQAPDDELLQRINRGHGVKEIITATRLLKNAGFKITYHLMPGLPGSNLNKDLKMLEEIFTNPDFKPDNIKFYPTSVVKYSLLQKWHEQGLYKPYDEKTLIRLILEFKKRIVPRWVRIQRLVRDLTVNDIVVDTFPSNLRQKIEHLLQKNNIRCPCIRCREIKNERKNPRTKLKTTVFDASGGKEYFLEIIDNKDRLYGLLRLRIVSKTSAIVRELHVYGTMLEIGKSDKTRVQHQGLGKLLLEQAEYLTKKHGIQKLAVISGIGAKEYYRALGYKLEHTYMVKFLR